MTRTLKSFVEKKLLLLKWNKSTGRDDLPPGLLEGCVTYISKPLCHILNFSIELSAVWKIWKASKISPIFKSGNTKIPENYRPVLVLPVLSKILEKVILSKLLLYLEKNKLLTEFQFSFHKHCSTKMATTHLSNQIQRKMSNDNMVSAVYLDLSKAFDTVGHDLLINKLSTYGVSERELAWFTDYLFGRMWIVEIENTQSNPEPIYCGVPQGSILGPPLFIIFFNDLINIMNVNVIKYADDAALFYADSDINKIESVLKYEMKKIGLYCNQNELLLNLKKGKTEAMLFGTQNCLKLHGRDLNISYNGINITFVKSMSTLVTNLTRTFYWIPILNKSTNMLATGWDFFTVFENTLILMQLQRYSTWWHCWS